MAMTKRGIMVKFLVTLILAILIFAPACMFASNFFRLSKQAQENFFQFTEEVNKVVKSPHSEEASTFVLIIDKDSVVYKFTNPVALKTPTIAIPYPDSDCKKKQCIVLCREFKKTNGVQTCIKEIGVPLEDGMEVMPFFLSRLEVKFESSKVDPLGRRTAIRIQKIGAKISVTS